MEEEGKPNESRLPTPVDDAPFDDVPGDAPFDDVLFDDAPFDDALLKEFTRRLFAFATPASILLSIPGSRAKRRGSMVLGK